MNFSKFQNFVDKLSTNNHETFYFVDAFCSVRNNITFRTELLEVSEPVLRNIPCVFQIRCSLPRGIPYLVIPGVALTVFGRNLEKHENSELLGVRTKIHGLVTLFLSHREPPLDFSSKLLPFFSFNLKIWSSQIVESFEEGNWKPSKVLHMTCEKSQRLNHLDRACFQQRKPSWTS